MPVRQITWFKHQHPGSVQIAFRRNLALLTESCLDCSDLGIVCNRNRWIDGYQREGQFASKLSKVAWCIAVAKVKDVVCVRLRGIARE